ncbi:hypothetical protein B0A48_01450 [Cryoendolithus antarcticus]|uniref:3,4-dihydroxy-2-butanone-4-phosphate synthase n=1 Tax=Cryoendolithus antarcticus TaxID=1507870 RepID=A0A1V8TPU4_9PEZI|nr:hypothetical protein B0A48_01450 [Cryoendolithus antarcticus]
MAQPNGVPHFDTIEDAIDSFAAGKFIIVLDNEDRENEGDLIIAASALTPAKAAFLVRHTSGYVCAPLTPARAAELELPQMVTSNEDPNRTAYTITVDAAEGYLQTEAQRKLAFGDQDTSCLFKRGKVE